MTPRDADVLVVGGGPAGSAVAALAARSGAEVLVLERARFPRDKLCGEFLAAEARGVLERLGVLDDLIRAGATSIDGIRLSSLRGRELRAALPDLPGIGREALGVSRRLLDATLLEHARRAGADVLERVEAVAPVLEGGRVTGVRVREMGRGRADRNLRAPVVVAADGRRSALVRALHPHLGDPRTSGPGSWFGLKTHVEADPATLSGSVELHLFDGGYAGLGAVEDGRLNLCLMVTVRALRACGGSPDALLEGRVLANPVIRAVLERTGPRSPWKSVGPLRFGVRRPVSHGALFVGDAAGTVDPFSGEGMAHALRGAEIAAPFVAEAARLGGTTPTLEAGYRRAWLRAFARSTRRLRWLGWLLERHRAGEIAGRLLSGAGAGLLPALIAATRTGTSVLRAPGGVRIGSN